jgi:hypothetical protein
VSRKSNRGTCIAPDRLRHNLLLGDASQATSHFVIHKLVCEHVNALAWDDRPNSSHGLFKQAAATKELEQLLRASPPTEGPETRPASASQDYGIGALEGGIFCHGLIS